MLTLALTFILFIGLGLLSFIDIREFRLPDVLTFPLIAVGLLASWLTYDRLIHALIGAAVGYLILFAVETLYRSMRGRDGLGRGDAKLLAAGGAWCAWWSLPHILLVASLSGLAFIGLKALIKRKGIKTTDRLPFGPFIALGIGLLWLINAYWPDLVVFN